MYVGYPVQDCKYRYLEMYVFVIRMYMGYTCTLYMYMYMTMCLRYACELHFHRVVFLFIYICMTICLRYIHIGLSVQDCTYVTHHGELDL